MQTYPLIHLIFLIGVIYQSLMILFIDPSLLPPLCRGNESSHQMNVLVLSTFIFSHPFIPAFEAFIFLCIAWLINHIYNPVFWPHLALLCTFIHLLIHSMYLPHFLRRSISLMFHCAVEKAILLAVAPPAGWLSAASLLHVEILAHSCPSQWSQALFSMCFWSSVDVFVSVFSWGSGCILMP